MTERPASDIRQSVREHYASVARGDDTGCGCAPQCCAPRADQTTRHAKRAGYGTADLLMAPPDANLGLACGNPQALVALEAGQTVLDLGSGGGFDCFLAARAVGPTGRVIGVDMTPEMIDRARRTKAAGNWPTVEFRLGEIEHLPVADGEVDVILSNCVVNLSTDKPAAFREAWRVLRPGGRLAMSDVVLLRELPAALAASPALHASCIAGASHPREVEQMLAAAGFEQVQVVPRRADDALAEWINGWSGDLDASAFVTTADIRAVKPA
jgi:SAM-dependent methyltransferase